MIKRKGIFILITILILAILMFGCVDNNNKIPDNQSDNTENSSSTENSDDINNNDGSEITEKEKIESIFMYINDYRLEVILADNVSTEALVELLKLEDIVYTAHNYGGFEKVGSIGHSLPTNNEQIKAESGDVMLYQGNQIVVFYGTNTWSYTRIGKIKDYSTLELKSILGDENEEIKLSIK